MGKKGKKGAPQKILLETKFDEICFRKCFTPIFLKHGDESITLQRFHSPMSHKL